MKSCPTPAVEFSKIQNGFDTAGSLFQKTSAELVPHMFDRVQVQQQARPWKTSDVLLIFVFLDELGRGRLAMFLGLELAIDPLPHRGNFVHYDFLKQHYIRHKIKDVSSLRVAALTCNITLYTLPPKIALNVPDNVSTITCSYIFAC